MSVLKKTALVATAALAMSMPFTASAAGDAAAGKAKAAVCVACHGANGKAMIPTYPNLAGQNAPYMVSALKAFRAKERTGGQAAVMQGQAAALSDADIDNLAAYFSSLK
ncbi:MAG: cytochrome c [Hahellaceae bacterium]|nr:cytochrome c [Hahellaceae bacterium]MCP5169186.1 cytochrome c [Hahellaceae bacterium]